jgi:hypothetical protein
MSKHYRVSRVFLGSIVAALMATAALASVASASPQWNFAGTPLTGSETITGSATASTLALPGLVTKCDFSYSATISNNAGTAEGSVTSTTINNCSTDGVCTVTSAKAESLPAIHTKTVGKSNYVTLDGVKIGILYGNPLCVLDETNLVFKGSAGALFNNASSTFTFSLANSEATGSKLTAFGTTVKWDGVFSTAATGSHKGQALTLS